jgi:hypothetical protein
VIFIASLPRHKLITYWEIQDAATWWASAIIHRHMLVTKPGTLYDEMVLSRLVRSKYGQHPAISLYLTEIKIDAIYV